MLARKATAKDLPRLAELFTLVDRDFIPPLSQRGSIKGEARKALGQKNHCCLIVEDGGKVTAAASFIENYRKKNSAYIKYLIVHPGFRGKGIGISLRKKVLSVLKKDGMKEVHSRTWSTNRAMLEINKKMGFEVEKIIKNERAPGIDGVYFRKKLQHS